MRRIRIQTIMFLVISSFGTFSAFGQGSSTDIFLVEMQPGKDSLILGTPVNMTNRSGYDNQPHFTPDGKYVLYTSIREDGQADCYRYSIKDQSTIRLTTTEESEYSPTVMPGGKSFSVVRVEVDQTQRLWQFDLDGKKPELILKDIKPVGYHVWGDKNSVVLFVLGSPPELHMADINTGKSKVVTTRIGRSLHKVPGSYSVSFVHKISSDSWQIQRLDLQTHEMSPIFETLPGSEDYVWTPHGTILMGKGMKLYQRTPVKDQTWREIADFTVLKGERITRIALSPLGDRLAMVVDMLETE